MIVIEVRYERVIRLGLWLTPSHAFTGTAPFDSNLPAAAVLVALGDKCPSRS